MIALTTHKLRLYGENDISPNLLGSTPVVSTYRLLRNMIADTGKTPRVLIKSEEMCVLVFTLLLTQCVTLDENFRLCQTQIVYL